jgi:hypothetical protein
MQSTNCILCDASLRVLTNGFAFCGKYLENESQQCLYSVQGPPLCGHYLIKAHVTLLLTSEQTKKSSQW